MPIVRNVDVQYNTLTCVTCTVPAADTLKAARSNWQDQIQAFEGANLK